MPREREPRLASSNEDETPGRDAQRPAGRETNAAAEPRVAEHAPVSRMTLLPRVVREKLWLIALFAVVLSGLATLFVQVAAPHYGVLVFALVTGPALLAGLVFGTGTALLLEHVARRLRGSVYGVSASQAQGMVGQDAHQRRASEVEPWETFHLGSEFDRQGEYDLAEEAYQRVIASGHPEAAPRAAFNLGLMLDKQGEYARAQEAYQQVIDSKHAEWAPKAVFNLGMLFEHRGEYDLAEQAYQQAIDTRHPEVAPKAVGNFLGLLRRLTARESSDKESSES